MQKEWSLGIHNFLFVSTHTRRDDISIAFDFSCIIMMFNMFQIPFDIVLKMKKKLTLSSIDKITKVSYVLHAKWIPQIILHIFYSICVEKGIHCSLIQFFLDNKKYLCRDMLYVAISYFIAVSQPYMSNTKGNISLLYKKCTIFYYSSLYL